MKTKTRANGLDKKIGKKLRSFRQKQNISQTALARDCGITFQQIQKYERGINRISASRLWKLSKILDLSITEFFPEEKI